MDYLLFDNMTQCTAEEVERMTMLVSEQRREQALRYKHIFGQFACLKSYCMLLELLRKHRLIGANECPDFVVNAYGKPRLAGANECPDFVVNACGKPRLIDANGNSIEALTMANEASCLPRQEGTQLDFSISHCRKGILVAIDTQPIGVDIESVRRVDEALVEHTMNSREIEEIHASDNPDMAFTRLWTQKEAVLKQRGIGINCDLRNVLTTNPLPNLQTIVDTQKGYAYSLARKISPTH